MKTIQGIETHVRQSTRLVDLRALTQSIREADGAFQSLIHEALTETQRKQTRLSDDDKGKILAGIRRAIKYRAYVYNPLKQGDSDDSDALEKKGLCGMHTLFPQKDAIAYIQDTIPIIENELPRTIRMAWRPSSYYFRILLTEKGIGFAFKRVAKMLQIADENTLPDELRVLARTLKAQWRDGLTWNGFKALCKSVKSGGLEFLICFSLVYDTPSIIASFLSKEEKKRGICINGIKLSDDGIQAYMDDEQQRTKRWEGMEHIFNLPQWKKPDAKTKMVEQSLLTENQALMPALWTMEKTEKKIYLKDFCQEVCLVLKDYNFLFDYDTSTTSLSQYLLDPPSYTVTGTAACIFDAIHSNLLDTTTGMLSLDVNILYQMLVFCVESVFIGEDESYVSHTSPNTKKTFFFPRIIITKKKTLSQKTQTEYEKVSFSQKRMMAVSHE